MSANFKSTSASGAVYDEKQVVLASVKQYYGKVLASTKDLQTSACTVSGKPPQYIRNAIKNVPNSVLERFYGCGNPLPDGIAGKSVLDLGSGSGRDCFVAAQLVGPSGSVTGIDMTDEQLAVARNAIPEFTAKNPQATSKLRFVTGYIEDLVGAGVEKNSIDVCISNCVVNLSPNKPAVLAEVYDVLKNGGEFYFSDVYCDRRLPESVRSHELLFGECIAGALYVGDFAALAKSVGFTDPRVLSVSEEMTVSPQLRAVLGAARFYSITYRLFKLAGLESQSEDYGQIAWYKGTISAFPFTYQLDDHHVFEKDRPVLVCGNTASMLSESWLGAHFRIQGDRSVHFGIFPGCGGVQLKSANSSGDAGNGAGCGGGGGCL